MSCQYCGDNKNLTFDHVIPRSRGGITCWENVVSACCTCNVRKGGKLPQVSGMIPKTKPSRPTVEELHDNGKFFPPNFLHQSWLDYLYWDVKLES